MLLRLTTYLPLRRFLAASDELPVRARSALVLAFGLLLCVSAVQAQDYEREKRLAQELLPGVLVGEAVQLPARDGRNFLGLFAKGAQAKRAVVLVHGVGTHPDHGVIGQLRQLLNDAGHTTLSIQMPVQGRDAKLEDYYPTVFAEAKDRIARAGAWLASEGYAQPALVSHSMGSWMVNEYLDERHSDEVFAAWVCLSLTGAYSWTARSYRLPIFDIYAEHDIPASVSSAWRRRWALPGAASRQLMVEGAPADYSQFERQLAREISVFLRGLSAPG